MHKKYTFPTPIPSRCGGAFWPSATTGPSTPQPRPLLSLNNFYAWFERDNLEPAIKAPRRLPATNILQQWCERLMHRKLQGLTVSPNAFSEYVLWSWRGSHNRLMSLTQAIVSTSIVPVPKHSTATRLDDYSPVVLTPSLPSALSSWSWHTSKSVLLPPWTAALTPFSHGQ